MSVVPMKKADLLVHYTDVESVLQTVQSVDAIEFSALAAETTEAKPVVDVVRFPHAGLLPRVQQMVHFLEDFEQKKGLFRTLLEGSTIPVTEKMIHTYSHDVENVTEQVVEVEQLQAELAEIDERVRMYKEYIEFAQAWQALPYELSALQTDRTVTTLVQRKSTTIARNDSSLTSLLTDALAELEVEAVVHAVRDDACSVTVMRDEGVKISLAAVVKDCGAEPVEPPPGGKTLAEEMERYQSELAAATAEQVRLYAQAESFAKECLHDFRITTDVLTWQKERYAVLEHAQRTEQTVVLHGWVNALMIPELEKRLAAKQLLYVLETREPEVDEEPPVEITNNALIKPFEVVTRLYGLPGHRDIDPTVFLAGFFFLFFGLSLTDVGYGIFLMTAALLVMFVLQVSKTIKMFGRLLFLMGLSSALVGLLFGGYLGVDPTTLPATLQAIQQFDPIGNPLPVFYLALALGVVQVMFGMVLKIVSDARNGRLLDGVLDQGPWLALFIAAILYGASQTGYAFVLYADELLLSIYAAIIAIVVASGRKGDTILQKIQASLLSVYQSIGFFSDILSYSRLLALGLATTALAFAVNLIADIVRESVPYVGVVLAIMVLIVGHAFTLAVNTLGAFIHSARLQFVEFFGKFISGTGKTFKPLSRNESYVTVVSDET